MGEPDNTLDDADETEIKTLRARMKEAADAIEDGDHDAALVLLRAGKPRLKPEA